MSGALNAPNCDFVTGGADGFVCLWTFNSESETVFGTLDVVQPESRLQDEVLVSPDVIEETGTSAAAARAPNVLSPVSYVASMRHHSLGVVSVAIASEANVGVSTSLDGALRIWDVSNPDDHGRNVKGMSLNEAEPWAVAISADGSRVVTGGSNGVVQIIDARRGLCVTTFNFDPKLADGTMCMPMAISLNTFHIAVGAQNGSVCVFDIETGATVGKEMLGHSNSVRGVAFLLDGECCVTCGDDGLVNFYDIETSQLAVTLRGHAGIVTCLSPSPCGRYLATGSSDRTLKVWDVDLREQIFSIAKHSNTVWDVAYLSNSKIVAVGEDSCISVFDCEQAETFTW